MIAATPPNRRLGTYGGEKRRAAVVKYLAYAVTGSVVMLVSILALKSASGAAFSPSVG